MQSPNCLNCDNPLGPTHKFCAECGQKSATNRLSLHEVSHDAVHYFTHADKSIFSLIGQLLRRPGKVQREYVEGKRKKYFPPLNFFLIVAAFLVFFVNMIGAHSEGYVVTSQEQEQINARKTPEGKARMTAIFQKRAIVTRFIDKYFNVVAMVATPLITAFIFLFYMKGKYNFTEHLVANMYISGITLLFNGVIIIPLQKLFHLTGFNFLLLTYFVFEIAYRAVSYYYFMHKGTTGSAVKAALVSVAAIIFWFIITSSIIFGYIAFG